jgi:hypothetical protein
MDLYRTSPSPRLLGLTEPLWGHYERYRQLLSRLGRFCDQDDARHGDLLQAVSDGRLEQAGTLLKRDLERGHEDLIAILKEPEQWVGQAPLSPLASGGAGELTAQRTDELGPALIGRATSRKNSWLRLGKAQLPRQR